MWFELLSSVTEIETIAAGSSIREIARLRKRYGAGRWRKRKGTAKSGSPMIRYAWRNFTGMKRMELGKGRLG
jgi:hypothetical protein